MRTPDAVSFNKVSGKWRNGKFVPGLYSKRPGAEGPLSAAIASNHIYVYGTQGNPSQEELAARRAQAAEAANWSAERGMSGRIMIFPRVVSDQQVRQSDIETSDMILFGTKETNAVIAKYADKLPMHMSGSANDYGLVYIFPLNGHYIVVNSGKVWWMPPSTAVQGGMAFSSQVSNAMQNYKDFILFRGTPDNVVSEGWFNDLWQIPAAEAERIKASGVVTVKE